MPFWRIIRPWENALIEVLGKYQRTVGSGLVILLPYVERLIRVDMRERVVDVPPQAVITKDNIVVEVDAVIYYKVTDPVKVTYNVSNFYLAVTKLAQTSLRNLIGDLALEECLISSHTINANLRQILDDATDPWGTKVTRVEIQRIEPPRDVTDAMHRQMKAERDRRATILEAEGHKKAAVLKAEGDAEAVKRAADAEKYRKETIAKAEAEAIEIVYGAITRSEPTQELITLKYLEALKEIADGQATKVFLPYEASALLGSLAGVGDLLSENRSGKPISAQKNNGRVVKTVARHQPSKKTSAVS